MPSRRQSVDTQGSVGGGGMASNSSAGPSQTTSTSAAPITYFPNPSSFHAAPSPISPRTNMSSSRPPSTSTSSTDDELDRSYDYGMAAATNRRARAGSNLPGDATPTGVNGAGSGARPGSQSQTPKMGSGRQMNSSATSSPRLARSSTLALEAQGQPMSQTQQGNRRPSVASTIGGGGGGGGGGVGHGPTRTLSTPVEGYGATHQHSTAMLAGLGLGGSNGNGNGAESTVSSIRRTKDDALASPRRISTSSPRPPDGVGGAAPGGGAGGTGRSSMAHRSPASLLNLPNLPTHEAYYSQPNTSTTPRFRDSAATRPTATHQGQDDPIHGSGGRRGHGYGHGQGAGRGHSRTHSLATSSTPGHGNVHANTSAHLLTASTSAASGLHHRNLSVQTTDLSPASGLGGGGPRSHAMLKSPASSVFRRLRKTASAVGLAVGGRPETYDGDEDEEGDEEDTGEDVDEGMSANGTRVWYSSFVTIDWIHDAIKESSRIRRLRHNAHKSWRGSIVNSWDRFQGWLVVTIIGVLSAVIAFLIIRSEMALFDLKEGFCTTSWGTPRRFCCAPHHRRIPGNDGEEERCGDWVEWGEVFAPHDGEGQRGGWAWGGPEFVAYAVVAVVLATLASTMTIYLSSSAHHTTSKDSTFLLPPSRSRATSKPSSPRTKRATDNGGVAPVPALAPEPPYAGTEREPLMSSISTMRDSDDREHDHDVDMEFGEGESGVLEPPRKVMYYAAGSGIPEIKTILSGFVIHGYLGGWTLLTKSVGLALSVASGLSLGKEGPLVHISSCVGNIVSRLFIKFECNEAKRREILSAACAAGVAVAFGAPIGGVLFSLEEVSYYFPPKVMWRSFWCAAVAAITLKSLNPFGNGSLVLFAVTYTKKYHYWEYIIFVILGIFGGVYGAIFSRLNILWSKHVRQGTWVKSHPIVEVVLVTALTTVVSFLNPYCRMGGTELVASIAQVIWAIGSALIIKGCLTIITFGIKLPAGIFIPSLAVGACFGRIVGLAMEYVEYSHPDLGIFGICKDETCIVPGLYAMIGAAATLAGVTRTTVSLAVIVLELTNTLNYVVPVMLGVLVAKTVADGLEKKGIYDLVIDLNQLPYLDSKGEYLWGGRRVSEIADTDVPHLRADKTHTVRSLTGKLLELVRLGMEDTGFPVLVKEQVEGGLGRSMTALRIVGFLGMNELEHALNTLADEPDANLNLLPEDATRPKSSVMSIFSFAESYSDPRHNPYDISRYIDRAPLLVQTHSPLELVQQLFVKLGARQLMVVDSRGTYKGVVTKKAWLAFLTELEEENDA